MSFPRSFDGHNDTLTHILRPDRGNGRSFFERSELGQVDLPRAQIGGLGGAICSIFTPPPAGSPESDPLYGMVTTENGYEGIYLPAVEHGYAREFTLQVFDFAHQIAAESSGCVAITTDAAQLERNFDQDIFSMVLGMEGAAAIKPNLSDLADYYERGLRVLNPVWSRANAFGHGVPFSFPHSPDTGPGLTTAGKALIAACNDLGVLIDLAHINEKGFWDVAELSSAPLVSSHTAVHAICPLTRNLTDAQIKAIGRSGGLIGVYYMPMGLRPDGKTVLDTPLSAIVEHIDYIVDLIGIDHVGLGSDFDGALTPFGLADCAALPHLMHVLKTSGYSEADLAKIAHKNWLRVFQDTWRG